MKLTFILSIFSFLSICNSFRLAQYNAEWLFIDQYENCPGSGCTWSNQSEAQKHLSVVATNINNINADYINFCEVEGVNELNMVANQSMYDYKSYLIKGTDTSTGQNVGVLTKITEPMILQRTEDRYNYPISGSKCGCTTSGSSGVSKHYINTFLLNNFNLTVIGVHFLAYPTDSIRCAEREAQATIIRNYVDKYLDLGNQVIVMGDFNDFDGTYIDANNNIPISQVLEIIKQDDLYTSAAFIEKSKRKTDWWDQNNDCSSVSTEFSMLDHILMSSYLYNHIENVWIYTYPEYCGTYNSDHFPIIVDFNF